MPTKAVALVRSAHPGPTIAVTVVSVALGWGAALEPWRIALVGCAFLANQLSVGLSNDWLDAERDRAVGRTDKPVALNQIAPSTVRAAAFTCAAIAVALTVPLGWLATIAHVVFIASAWTYNLGLKKTVFSVLPYVVSFGILPAVVTLSHAPPMFTAPWALCVGAVLGIAAHFANVLPDLEDDRATGVRGLPHRIGRAAVGFTTYLLLAIATVIAFFGAGALALPVAPWALGLNLAICVLGTLIAGRATRWHFRLIMIAALVLVAMLAFAGGRLFWS